MKNRIATLALALLLPLTTFAQWTPDKPGSDNIEVLGHIPLGPPLSVADMELEQELNRPFAYVSRMVYGETGPKGTDIIDLSDPSAPRVIYRWRIENQDLAVRGEAHFAPEGTGGPMHAPDAKAVSPRKRAIIRTR